MSESMENVKSVAEFLREAAAKKNVGTHMHQVLSGHANVIDQAVEEIAKLRDLTSALPADLGSIHDLPQELLDELSVAKTDELEDQLVTVINAYGGEASLDQILVGLYRKFKVSQKRRFLQNKLYRMTVIWGVDGKKGIYTTTEPPPSLNENIKMAAARISGPLGTKELSDDPDNMGHTNKEQRDQFEAPSDQDEESEIPF